MKNTILVTGGAGFIGSHLIEKLLPQGHSVVCIDNYDPFYSKHLKETNLSTLFHSSNFVFYEGDIRDKDFMEGVFAKHKIDVVVHLAAKAGVRPSVQDPVSYFDVNVNGTIHLMEAMNRHGVKKLVNASSSSIYGNNRKIPYAEIDSVDFPVSPYAASKKSSELITYTYHHLYQMDVVNLRFFTVYGPRQRPDLAIHKFFRHLYEGKAIEMYGDGSTSRDYTFVEDTVQGITSAITWITCQNGVYEIINLGNHTPVKLTELIAIIEKVTGKSFNIQHMPMQPGDVDITYADIQKASKLLEYKPETSIENGLIRFKLWFESFLASS